MTGNRFGGARRFPFRGLWSFITVVAVFMPAVSATDIIVCGSGGSKEYVKKFSDWGVRLREVLTGKLSHDPQAVHLFLENPNEAGSRKSELASLRDFFGELAKNHDPQKTLFVYLIGHGSYLRDVSKFQVPGQDLRAEELNALLGKIPAKAIVVINAASASAGFINVLSGENRIVCTATKSVEERNATEFMELFLQALEDGIADRNRDERISVWEACSQAASLTRAWYGSNGFLPTEHALLDDNGDGLGTRLFLEPEELDAVQKRAEEERLDGALARVSFLKDFGFPANVPKPLVNRYLSLLDGIEDLKARKGQLDTASYYRELEDRLVQAARLHREIRELRGSVD